MMSTVAFGRLPDGRILLAGGRNDRTVRLWDSNKSGGFLARGDTAQTAAD